MKFRYSFILTCLLTLTSLVNVGAQTQKDQVDTVLFGGKKMIRIITERGDTVFVDQLDELNVSSRVQFSSKEEYDLYQRYKRYAAIVYPYALEAMRIYYDAKETTRPMTNRERKKYMKQLEKELEDQFEEPLKKLTRTQGKILTKMIEKELDRPFYDVVKEIKGGWSAFYYNTSGKFYGYNLKEGYIPGQDKLMDMVLDDYRLSVRK